MELLKANQDYVEEVQEVLKRNFVGASNSYTIITVIGLDKEDVIPVIADFLYTLAYESDNVEDEMENIESKIIGLQTDNADNYSFILWDSDPSDAQIFSQYLPGCLVIGDLSWNYNIVEIYLNGEKAVPNKDYQMTLWYEANGEYGDFDGNYYDAEWTITDSYGYATNSGSGMICEEDLQGIRELATEQINGRPDEKEQELE